MAYFNLTDADVSSIIDRYTNGPYKTEGDTFTNSPNTVERIDEFSGYFMSGTVAEHIITSDLQKFWDFYSHYPLAAATKYLITNDSTIGNKVKSYLLTQAAESYTDFTTWPFYHYNTNANGVFFAAAWVNRLLMMYDYTKDLFTSG
jgi:hypothetical protein